MEPGGDSSVIEAKRTAAQLKRAQKALNDAVALAAWQAQRRKDREEGELQVVALRRQVAEQEDRLYAAQGEETAALLETRATWRRIRETQADGLQRAAAASTRLQSQQDTVRMRQRLLPVCALVQDDNKAVVGAHETLRSSDSLLACGGGYAGGCEDARPLAAALEYLPRPELTR
jgi:hypothetical protein